MKHFISSDHHFSHKNIRKYCPLSRGHLNSIEEMNEELIEKHNFLVGENDHTYILGDVGFCSPKDTLNYLSRMNGVKTLIYGNHDASFIKSGVLNRKENLEHARIIHHCSYLEVTHKVDDEDSQLVLFHFEIAAWNRMHHGSFHLHGHAHGSGPVHPGRCMDIGVDTNDLYPYGLDDVVRVLRDKPVTFSGHHDSRGV